MNQQAAISYLKLLDEFSKEDIIDAFEEQIFSIKKDLLSKSISISRYKNKKNLIEKLIEAKNSLLQAPDTLEKINDEVFFAMTTLLAFMQDYEQQLSIAKLLFSNATNDEDLLVGIERIIDVQTNYETKFSLFFEKEKSINLSFEGKLSEQVDSSLIILYLKKNNDLYKKDNPCLKEFIRLNNLS